MHIQANVSVLAHIPEAYCRPALVHVATPKSVGQPDNLDNKQANKYQHITRRRFTSGR